jgi:hypothetical protein
MHVPVTDFIQVGPEHVRWEPHAAAAAVNGSKGLLILNAKLACYY